MNLAISSVRAMQKKLSVRIMVINSKAVHGQIVLKSRTDTEGYLDETFKVTEIH